MAPITSSTWITDPEYTALFNYIIEKTENVESPMSVLRMARQFKEKSGTTQTENGLRKIIQKMRTRIHSFEHMDTDTKVKILFALSAPVDADFLRELKEDAVVEIDDKKRITLFKANNGSFKLTGDHGPSAKSRAVSFESKQCLRSLIIDYFENKNDSNAIPKNQEEKEMGNLIEFITEKCANVNSPLSIRQLGKDFIQHFGISTQLETIRQRIGRYCREIQTLEFLDTHTKVKQLFGLSVTLDSEFLEKLRKNALVEVDENSNRITYYKANDGSLELRGCHSMSTKVKTARFDSKRCHRSLIVDYFESKNDSNAVSKNEEMGSLIEFIADKCQNANYPLSITKLAKDFNKKFGTSLSFHCTHTRIRRYCREIQRIEFLDTPSKVKQLFCLSVKLDSDCLEELRKDADVEVDNMNRITKYTANDGHFTLYGDHSQSAKNRMVNLASKRNQRTAVVEVNHQNRIKKYTVNDGSLILNGGHSRSAKRMLDWIGRNEHDDDQSEDYTVEYASEEFDGEFDSDDDNYHLDESEDLMEQSNEAFDFDNETPVRNRSEMSFDDYFDFDPSFERSHGSEEIETRDDDGGKRKNSPPIASTSEKKRNRGTTEFGSSNWTGSPLNNEIDNFDTNYSIDDRINLEPIFGSTQEDLNGIKTDEDIQQILKTLQELQAPDEYHQIEKIPIAVEHEEPVEVEPETAHNPKIKFFETMHSLILCLNIPSLSSIQSKINENIEKIRGPDEVILNDDIVLMIDLLIARMNFYSVENLSKNADSVNLSNFLCYLKAAIQISRMSGVEDLVENISELIDESQNKRIPVEAVSHALCATLDINDP